MNVEYKVLNWAAMCDLFTTDHDCDDPRSKYHISKSKIKYFSMSNGECGGEKFVFFCAFINNDLVGIAKLKTEGRPSLRNPEWKNWISYVSVHEDYFGHGIGKNLVQNLFEYCKKENLSVLTSEYSVRGWFHLRKCIRSCADKLGVVILDKHTRPGFLDWKTCENFTRDEYQDIVESFNKTKNRKAV